MQQTYKYVAVSTSLRGQGVAYVISSACSNWPRIPVFAPKRSFATRYIVLSEKRSFEDVHTRTDLAAVDQFSSNLR
jgi:hypothetical protein